MASPEPRDWILNRPTHRSVSHLDSEICVNCWYYVDSTGVVLRLAARAYALTGTDDEKLAVLRVLSGADHLTAIAGRIPDRYVLECDGTRFVGALPSSVLEMDPIPVFEDLFAEVARALPTVIASFEGEYIEFENPLKEPFLWVATAVFEENDGSLVARLSI